MLFHVWAFALSGETLLLTLCQLLVACDVHHPQQLAGALRAAGDPARWPGFGEVPGEHLAFLRSFAAKEVEEPRPPAPIRRKCAVEALQQGAVQDVEVGPASTFARAGGPMAALKVLCGMFLHDAFSLSPCTFCCVLCRPERVRAHGVVRAG